MPVSLSREGLLSVLDTSESAWEQQLQYSEASKQKKRGCLSMKWRMGLERVCLGLHITVKMLAYRA